MEQLKTFEMDEKLLERAQSATIKTQKGAIRVKLYGKSAPQAVMNFATLAESGFYRGLAFHRVIKGFMAQGGCPFSREDSGAKMARFVGTGGPGYRIKCETAGNPKLHTRGALSMAHAGKDTGGSQFFICFVPCPHLDGQHTVFGGIAQSDKESLAVLDSITQGDRIEDIVIGARE